MGRSFLVVIAALLLIAGDFYPDFLPEIFDGFGKGQAFHFHEEFEDVSAFLGTEAIIHLPGGSDGK
jgi:hypothetical protein